MSSALLCGQASGLSGLQRRSTQPFRTARPSLAAPRARGQLQCRAGNLLLEILGSSVGAAAVTAVTTFTSENRDDEIERLQTPEGLAPIGAALVADAVLRSVPGVGALVALLTEPAGAAAGVAYLMTLVLSSPSVDPKTLAPSGTILNAKKADDVRAAVRVPFTRIIPTALSVIDTTNDSSSGAGWASGDKGLPKLPITSVVAVIGVGTVIVEVLGHAPVLSLVLPRVLTVAAWLAAIGAVLDKREAEKKSA